MFSAEIVVLSIIAIARFRLDLCLQAIGKKLRIIMSLHIGSPMLMNYYNRICVSGFLLRKS